MERDPSKRSGRLSACVGGRLLEQIELGSYPVGGEQEAEEALAAAVAAYDEGRGVWPTMTVADRIACMQDFTNQMIAAGRRLSDLIMWEIGKTQADSEKEFDRTVDYIRATIEALKELDNSNSRFQIVEGTIGQIRRTPLGVVLCMGPYNYPLNETFATLIPALIMGNTVVFKPPRYGALLFYPLLEAFRSAFPKGVINTVYGRGSVIVPRLLDSGKVNVLTLIGSSKVADHLKKLHSEGASPAGHSWSRRQERRHRPAGRRYRACRQGMPPRDPVLQRPALHGAQDADRPSVDRRAFPAPLHRGVGQAQGRHALGEGREHHAAA